MKVINLVRRDFDDPFFCVMGEDHKLVTSEIDGSDPLCERFNDTRTPYEQYCDGEEYLKYDEETLYSRLAHEWMFRNVDRHIEYPQRNFEIKFPLLKGR